MLITQDAAEAQDHATIDRYQKAVKIFKFKKYKEGSEDGKWDASPRYPLEFGAFLKSQGLELPEGSVVPATTAETSSGVSSCVFAPLATSPPPTALATDFVTLAAPRGRYASDSPF